MEAVSFSDPKLFLETIEPFLMEHEAEYNLMLGIARRMAQNPAALPDGAVLCAVVDEQGVVGAAIRTPPYHAVITDLPDEAAVALVDTLIDADPALPGVLGPVVAAGSFAERWGERTGKPARVKKGMRIYRLNALEPVPAPSGKWGYAEEGDTEQATAWAYAFDADVDSLTPHQDEVVRRAIGEKRLVFWRDPAPVAMAMCGGATPNGIRVNMVYTPPEQRRKGYATALVAAFSQRLLDEGRQFCFLYTDLANPTANSIYAKMGYRPVCDCTEFVFGEP